MFLVAATHLIVLLTANTVILLQTFVAVFNPCFLLHNNNSNMFYDEKTSFSAYCLSSQHPGGLKEQFDITEICLFTFLPRAGLWVNNKLHPAAG